MFTGPGVLVFCIMYLLCIKKGMIKMDILTCNVCKKVIGKIEISAYADYDNNYLNECDLIIEKVICAKCDHRQTRRKNNDNKKKNTV